MKANMGKLDKKIRIVIAVVLFSLYYSEIITGTWAIVSIVLAIIFALTSFISFCPLYLLFKISTKKD